MGEEFREVENIQNLEGRYADDFRIGYSAYRFVLDFGQSSLESGKMQFHTRVVMVQIMPKPFLKIWAHQ
jgi:hypothetical protein